MFWKDAIVFNTEDVITAYFPKVANNQRLLKPMNAIMRHLLHEQELLAFSDKYPHLSGIDFVEQMIEHFDFSYTVSNKHKERIPSTGKVVIVANHPIGTLDGLALIKMIKEVRPDVKVIANSLLMNIEPMHELLLPVQNMQGNTPKKNLSNINQHLQQESAIIVFPAGEVSRLRPSGVKDTKWQKGFLRLAKANQCPILPIHLDARNSAFFYGVSMVYKPAATAMLVREMFNKKNKAMHIHIGDIIPYSSFSNLPLSLREQVKLIKRHVYRLPKNKPPLLVTQSAIAMPEERRELLKAIQQECEELGKTPDGKVIYLYRYQQSSPIMRELGRLRELTFRAVGEGTNQRRDIDLYDKRYFHLVLWDEYDLEIAGAYRFADTKQIKAAGQRLYSETLFDYQEQMAPYFEKGLELGRSFVQQKYWGKRSLDYLWIGIGAFLTKHPEYRYLFGPVTLSAAQPAEAISLITSFYSYYFPDRNNLASAKIPYPAVHKYWHLFTDLDRKQGFALLKARLSNLGASVPTLFKQYSEVCEPTGVRYCGFNIDPDFQNCVDGLVMVDIAHLKPAKKRRYLTREHH